MDQEGNTALAVLEEQRPKTLARASDSPQMTVGDLVAHVKMVHEVQRHVMQEGHHYGKIPGVEKACLFKPGAEILGMTFRLDPQFTVDERRDGEHREYFVTCTLYHAPTGTRLGSGLGSCSTRESRYAWRKAERACPKCNSASIIRGKEEYGGGWLCFGKKGGCGAKFKSGDKAIEEQQTGRAPNPDIADVYNTVLKMAVKRAHVAAILFVTCASDIFTQDVEDMPDLAGDPEPTPAPSRNGANKPAAQPDPLAFQRISKLIASAANRTELDAIVPELRRVSAQKLVSKSEFEQLRDLCKIRQEELESAADDLLDDARQPGEEG